MFAKLADPPQELIDVFNRLGLLRHPTFTVTVVEEFFRDLPEPKDFKEFPGSVMDDQHMTMNWNTLAEALP